MSESIPPCDEVLDLALAGHSSKVMGRMLEISYRTVELHRSNLLEKLEIASIHELLRLKPENGS